jgi:GNAT superfamily N-acetyltransferase
MQDIKVLPITMETVECASYVCSDPDDVGLEIADKGCNLKTQWAEDEIKKGFVPGFVAWFHGKPAGVFNLEHRKEDRLISIKCVWVPRKDHWDKGIASHILEKLIHYAKTTTCFDGMNAKAIIVFPFDGGFPEQKKWHEFMTRKGFVATPEDSCMLYYPIEPGFIYNKNPEKDGFFEDYSGREYILQEEDKNKVLVIEEPDICPYYHVFFAKTAAKILELKPEMEIIFLNSIINKDEVEKRGRFRGMVVKGKKIVTPSYHYGKFMEEVKAALE